VQLRAVSVKKDSSDGCIHNHSHLTLYLYYVISTMLDSIFINKIQALIGIFLLYSAKIPK